MSTRTSSPQPATVLRSSPRPSSWVLSRHSSCCSSSPTPCTWWSTSSTLTATKSTRPPSTSPEAQKPRALRKPTSRIPHPTPSTGTDSPPTLSSQARTSESARAGWGGGGAALKAFHRFWLCYHSRRTVVGQKERIPAQDFKLPIPPFVSMFAKWTASDRKFQRKARIFWIDSI